MCASRTVQTDVLVVGAGPAGLVAGLTLARYGARVLLVEKRTELSTLSRALVVSTRAMEILRSWSLEDEVRAGAAGAEPWGWVTRTLTSGEGTRIPLGYPDAEEAAQVSPTGPVWVPQDHLEPVLLARLREAPSGTVRLGSALVSLRHGCRGVRAVLCDDAPGGPTREVEARYVVGADGAHSTVRSLLGIGLEGPPVRGEYHGAQFSAPLSGRLRTTRFGLNVITHPAAAGILSPRGPGDRWHYGWQRGPGRPSLADCTEERLTELIATATGVADLRPRIERVTSFPFAARIADRYRDGRCLLVGDAAHQMTPRGGTGMNTAVQDAYDAGWKLAWVLRGWANADLLDTYETDRRDVALHNVARSADPDGAHRTSGEELPWDLNGRLAHHWLRRGGRRMSTLDLLGDGLTALTGPGGCDRVPPAPPGVRAPVTTHALDGATAGALGIAPGDAMLLRPDGREASRRPGTPVG